MIRVYKTKGKRIACKKSLPEDAVVDDGGMS